MLKNMARQILSGLARRLNRYAASINNYLARQDASSAQPEALFSQHEAPAHWLEKVRQGAPHLLLNDNETAQHDSVLQQPELQNNIAAAEQDRVQQQPEQHNKTVQPTTSSQFDSLQVPNNDAPVAIAPAQKTVTSRNIEPQSRQQKAHAKSNLVKQAHAVSANNHNNTDIQAETNKVYKPIQNETVTTQVNTELSPPIQKRIKKAADTQSNENLYKPLQTSPKKHSNTANPKPEQFNKHPAIALKAQPKPAYAPEKTHKKSHSQARPVHLTARPPIVQKKHATKTVQQQKPASSTAQSSLNATTVHNNTAQIHKTSSTAAAHHQTTNLNNRQRTDIQPDKTVPVNNTEANSSIADTNLTQQQANPRPNATQIKQTAIHNTIVWPALFDQVTAVEQQDKWPQLPESTYFKTDRQKQHRLADNLQQTARQREQEQRGTIWNA